MKSAASLSPARPFQDAARRPTPRPVASNLVIHPTTLWPTEALPSCTVSVTAGTQPVVARRAPRVVPLVAGSRVLLATGVLAFIIVAILAQNAQLIAAQYHLVALKQARTQQLKLRDELRLNIQRLTALDRVDGMSRHRLGMVRPATRSVIDLSAYRLTSAPVKATLAVGDEDRSLTGGVSR